MKQALDWISLALVLLCAGCGGTNTSQPQQGLYMQVINRIKSGQIKPSGSVGLMPLGGSTALLPSDLKNASVDGSVYIFTPSTNQLIVIFKTWVGKGLNMEGWLYAAVPLGPDDTPKDYYGKPSIAFGPLELEIENPVKTNWYRVSRGLD